MSLSLLGAVWWIAALVGCGPPPEPQIVLPPADFNAPPPRVAAPTTNEEAVPVALNFHNISELYRGFFADDRALEPLQRALAPCVSGTAQVWISYDDEKRIGQILLRVPPEETRCRPIALPTGYGLSPMEPLGLALAGFRDQVASNFDFRVANFRVGLSYGVGERQCNLMIAGQHPPNGRRWSPCVGFHDREVCGQGDAKTGVEALHLRDATRAEVLQACLRP